MKTINISTSKFNKLMSYAKEIRSICEDSNELNSNQTNRVHKLSDSLSDFFEDQ